jgi:hypothetical protein
MSRIPPTIKQHTNDHSVTGYAVQPITKDGVIYKIDSKHRLDEVGKIIGMDWSLEALDANSNVLWKTVYFALEFIRDLETDVQESYPVDFLILGEEIVIEHEYEGTFHISFDGVLLERKQPERHDNLLHLSTQ